VLFVRLGVRDGQIGEIETIVRREAPRLYDPANMGRPREIVFDTVDLPERSSRAELAAIGHGYFDGIEQLDAGLIAIREDCLRIENGSQTVLLDDVSAFEGTTAAMIFPMSVREQVESGYVAYIDAVRDRRIVAVEEARGLVAMVVVFDHPARVHSVAVKGIGEVALPEYHRSPNSMLIAELFKIRHGRIEHIEAVLESIPFGAPTGWDG
jgi:hypothetical protein